MKRIFFSQLQEKKDYILPLTQELLKVVQKSRNATITKLVLNRFHDSGSDDSDQRHIIIKRNG